MSGLPPTATEEPTFRFGGFVPTGDLCTAANQLLYQIISSARRWTLQFETPAERFNACIALTG